jgi:uncharacterized protein (TIGR02646 family)
MRRISKTHPPQELTKWRDDNKDVNHGYADLAGTNAHRDLKAKLIEEQGWLCAYTGRSIDKDSSHVEHLKPREACAEWEDVDYRNVVACFPANGGDVSHGYGAPVKKAWWDESRFISPLSEECERRFRFVWSGHVHPNPEEHEAAKATIDSLGLDVVAICQLRKKTIDGFFGLGPRTRSRPLSKEDAIRALELIDRPDSNGRLQEFCFVLKQLLPKYIAQPVTRS